MTSNRQNDRVLVDTHILLWTSEGRRFPGCQLSETAIEAIGNAHEAIVSTASLWEIAIKIALPGARALRLSLPYDQWIDRIVHEGGFTFLGIHESYLKRVSVLPPHHGDPFDRLLVAQSLAENMPIVSADSALDVYGVRRIW